MPDETQAVDEQAETAAAADEATTEQPSAADLDAAVAQQQAKIETKTYTDGTVATGVAPLPDQSPEQQEHDDEEDKDSPEDQAKKIVVTIQAEVENARAALAHLKTSSNAEHGGTIVNVAIKKFEAAIAGLEGVLDLIKKLSK